MAFSFAPQLAFLAGPLGAISAGRQYILGFDIFDVDYFVFLGKIIQKVFDLLPIIPRRFGG